MRDLTATARGCPNELPLRGTAGMVALRADLKFVYRAASDISAADVRARGVRARTMDVAPQAAAAAITACTVPTTTCTAVDLCFSDKPTTAAVRAEYMRFAHPVPRATQQRARQATGASQAQLAHVIGAEVDIEAAKKRKVAEAMYAIWLEAAEHSAT